MSEKKVTDVMLDRIKYFVNAIANGEYEPNSYEFTINLKTGTCPNDKIITLSDTYVISEK